MTITWYCTSAWQYAKWSLPIDLLLSISISIASLMGLQKQIQDTQHSWAALGSVFTLLLPRTDWHSIPAPQHGTTLDTTIATTQNPQNNHHCVVIIRYTERYMYMFLRNSHKGGCCYMYMYMYFTVKTETHQKPIQVFNAVIQ